MTTPSDANFLRQHNKDNELLLKAISKEKLYRIKKFLNAVPYLEFSATGIQNIAKRFGVPQQVINSLIEEARKG